MKTLIPVRSFACSRTGFGWLWQSWGGYDVLQTLHNFRFNLLGMLFKAEDLILLNVKAYSWVNLPFISHGVLFSHK